MRSLQIGQKKRAAYRLSARAAEDGNTAASLISTLCLDKTSGDGQKVQANKLSRFAGVSDPVRESGSPQAKSRTKRGIRGLTKGFKVSTQVAAVAASPMVVTAVNGAADPQTAAPN
jgi:hypothetical protein